MAHEPDILPEEYAGIIPANHIEYPFHETFEAKVHPLCRNGEVEDTVAPETRSKTVRLARRTVLESALKTRD